MLWAQVFAKVLVLVYADSIVSGMSGPGTSGGWSQRVDSDDLSTSSRDLPLLDLACGYDQ